MKITKLIFLWLILFLSFFSCQEVNTSNQNVTNGKNKKVREIITYVHHDLGKGFDKESLKRIEWEKYDNRNLITEIIYLNGDSVVVGKKNFYYDKYQQVSYSKSVSDNEFLDSTVYERKKSSNGTIVVTHSHKYQLWKDKYMPQGYESDSAIYDTNERLIERFHVLAKDTFAYNEKGQVSKIVKYVFSHYGDTSIFVQNFHYNYDSYGMIKEQVRFSDSTQIDECITFGKYDDQGNWLEKIVEEPALLSKEIFRRRIVYYK